MYFHTKLIGISGYQHVDIRSWKIRANPQIEIELKLKLGPCQFLVV